MLVQAARAAVRIAVALPAASQPAPPVRRSEVSSPSVDGVVDAKNLQAKSSSAGEVERMLLLEKQTLLTKRARKVGMGCVAESAGLGKRQTLLLPERKDSGSVQKDLGFLGVAGVRGYGNDI